MDEPILVDSISEKNIGTILLIEDEPALLHLTKEILISYGYSVFIANNGQEAWDEFGQRMEIFDLVITDVMMPKLSGPDFIKKVSSALALYKIEVLYLSGYTEGRLEALGVSADSTNVLEKPYKMEFFLQRVAEMVKRK